MEATNKTGKTDDAGTLGVLASKWAAKWSGDANDANEANDANDVASGNVDDEADDDANEADDEAAGGEERRVSGRVVEPKRRRAKGRPRSVSGAGAPLQTCLFQTTPEIWREFKAATAANGKTMRDVLNEMIERYVKKERAKRAA